MNDAYDRRGLASELAKIVGVQNVSVMSSDKIAYSRDMWPRAQIWVQQGRSCRYPPDCIVWPQNTEHVQRLMTFLHDNHVPVVPYGAGSGVCGGTIPLRGGVIVDMKAMNRVLSVDDKALTVEAESGIIGQHLEMELERRGYTLGHFPSSIYCSTLGGWLAARSAGQYSSKYGKIEDMTEQLEVVLPGGEVILSERGPFRVGGVDWNQLFIGSEGTLGIITRAVLKIHPAPVKRTFRGFHFDSVKEGTEACRAVMQAGLLPCLLRVYDPFDSAVAHSDTSSSKMISKDQILQTLVTFFASSKKDKTAGHDPDRQSKLQVRRRMKRQAVQLILGNPRPLNWVVDSLAERCLMVIGFEGGVDDVDGATDHALNLLRARGGTDLGPGPGEHWYQNRYSISYKQSPLYSVGAFVDTMEVATTWDRLLPLYDAVRKAVAPHAFIMAHFSHAYTEGCSIYFTFAGSAPDTHQLEQRYLEMWKAGLEAVVAQGATISHHHGVGVAKASFMIREHQHGVRLFAEIKKLIDPHGIMNPGKLFPDRELKSHGVKLAGRPST